MGQAVNVLEALSNELNRRDREIQDLRKRIDALAAQDSALLNEIFDKVVDAFEDREKAASWFLTPIVALAGNRPIDAIQLGDNGIKAIMHSIGVIKYGAPG